MFQRIAIVNRGEAAMRLIHAVRDVNAQAGPGGPRIEAEALDPGAERPAMVVREAVSARSLRSRAQPPRPPPARRGRALDGIGATSGGCAGNREKIKPG